MNTVSNLTSIDRFKMTLTITAQLARKENKINDFLCVIPNVTAHILWNLQMGIFTKEETKELINHITSLQEELLS